MTDIVYRILYIWYRIERGMRMQIQSWMVMCIVLIVLLIAAGILSVRLWCYRKQIRHMREELSLLEDADTNYQITSVSSIGETEELITAVNHLTVRYREERRKLIKENEIYRESITSISHDIRTPLTSAKGYLQLLQKKNITEEKRTEYLEIVEKRLDHLTDLLNQLFEYARIEAGEMEFEPEELNAANVFAETLSLFYDDFVAKGCEPEVRLETEPCRVLADRHAFVRVVENLIKNAMVHGTGGYQFLLTKEEKWMCILISNLTDSIGKEDVDKIFDRFYTTDKSRSRKTTGLGLAIVKRFAEAMGGEVTAYLKENRFTIEVRLPLILK